MKNLIIISFLIMLSGCGKWEQLKSYYTGVPTEACFDGVVYLQFTSGSSVKYERDGKVSLCH